MRAGESLAPVPLPDPTPETLLTTWFDIPEIPSVDAGIQEMIDRESLPENRIRVTYDLHELSPILERARNFFGKAAPGDDGLITPPKGKGYPSIIASPEQWPRAFLIMQALISALEARGYTVAITTDRWGECTRVTKEGEEVAISVYETSRLVKREPTREEKKKPPYLLNIPDQRRPSGKLSIRINTRFGLYDRFTDRQQQAMEDRLNEAVSAIVARLESLVAEKRRREVEQIRRQEEIRKREEERERREKLDEDASAWQKSSRLHEYLDAFEARMLGAPELTDSNGTRAEWLRWARDYATSLDPLERIFANKTNDHESKT